MNDTKIGLYQHKYSAPWHIGLPDEGYKKIATMARSDRDEDGKMGMEIVKRYNAYPELIAALELMADRTVEVAGHMDLARKHAHKLLETLNK